MVFRNIFYHKPYFSDFVSSLRKLKKYFQPFRMPHLLSIELHLKFTNLPVSIEKMNE